MDLKTHIGHRVKAARQQAGLTQEELADAVGKAVETISNLERGHTLTGIDTLEGIAGALGAPIGFFFEGYASGRKLSRRRAKLFEQVQSRCGQLSDEQIEIAIRLLAALKG